MAVGAADLVQMLPFRLLRGKLRCSVATGKTANHGKCNDQAKAAERDAAATGFQAGPLPTARLTTHTSV